MPQFEGLSLEKIKEYIDADPALRNYFPDDQDFGLLDKAFVCDLCYSVKQDEFEAWVNERIEARNEKRATFKDSQIVLDPRIAQVWKESKLVSSKYLQMHQYSNCALSFLTQLQSKRAKQ